MENDLILEIKQIDFTTGSVHFFDFENLKDQAHQLALRIENVEVSEENIQVSKKLLAAVNKRVKELEDKRIVIKKMMLKPYQEFESQIKEIVGIVKEADEIVRNQVREIEEMERVQKRDLLQEIFEKRLKHYSFRDLFGFDDFFQSKHLNKSTPIQTVENEMILFLEKVSKDLKVIETMPNYKRLLRAFLDTKDLGSAIALVNEQERREGQINASQMVNDDSFKHYIFSVFDEKDYKLIKLFMEQNQIKFEMEEGKFKWNF